MKELLHYKLTIPEVVLLLETSKLRDLTRLLFDLDNIDLDYTVVRNPTNTIAFFAMVFVFCIVGLNFCIFPSSDLVRASGFWEPASPTQEDSTDRLIQSVSTGLNGYWRVGYTTEHRITLKANRRVSLIAEIQTVDGDGVSIVYSDSHWSIDLESGASTDVFVYAKHGRPNRPIEIRVLDKQTGELLESRSLSDSERGTALPSEQPWMVGVGSQGMGLDAISSKSLKIGLADYSTTELVNAEDLPVSAEAWDGVDLLLLSSNNTSLLDQISPEQSQGIREWIQNESGRCVLTLGLNAEKWFANPHLSALVPGSLKGVDGKSAPGPLESYLNSESRLEGLGSAILQLSDVVVDLEGQSSNRNRFPLIAKWTSGLGKVKYFAGELESQSIQSWAGKPLLLKLLMSEQWAAKPTAGNNNTEDLSVQLHGSLDRFPKLIIGNLTQMTAIVFVLLLVIGPLDYFLVTKKWKSPRATWLTISLSAIGCCGLLVFLQKSWKPTGSTVNQTEVVDWDMVTQQVHGRVFAHVYGGKRGLYDISWQPSEKSLFRVAKDRSKTGDKALVLPDSRIDWFGMPGKSIGGFQSTIGTDRLLPGYRIERNSSSDLQIKGLAIPEAGTKSLTSGWTAQIEDAPPSDLKTVSGAMDLLAGTIVNPLPNDLLGGMLFYRGRFYTLPTRFASGDSITLTISNVPKDIARRLQRRISVDGKDQGTPWRSGDLTDVKRIFEIMLFHKAAGAGAYTIGQENRYLAWLDQSDLLKTDRAILFGELENRQVDWTAVRNGTRSDIEIGTTASFARVILPVLKGASSLSSPASPPLSATSSPSN
jgi:hypothetical protein